MIPCVHILNSFKLGFIVLLLALPFVATEIAAEKADITQFYSYGLDNESDLFEIDQEDCLVPCGEIVSGGPPPDGIPSIDNPQFYSVEEAEVDITDDEIVLGAEIDGQMRIYPYNILNWHEIVNIDIEGAIYSVTYCPLTGTGILYNTQLIENSELGTSGKLYQNNLVFYDRVSDSYWSQMYGLAIKGDKIGEQMDVELTIESTFGALKELYPDALVLSRDTGIYLPDKYTDYPYQRYNYLESETILFDTKYDKDKSPDNLFHPKSIVSIVQDGDNVTLFPLERIDTTKAVSRQLSFGFMSILYDASARLALPVIAEYQGDILQLNRINGSGFSQSETFGLEVYSDQLGNTWNMKGIAISGDAVGSQLTQVPAYNGFWFAAISFFPNADLFIGQELPDIPRTDPTNTDSSTTVTDIFSSLEGTAPTGSFVDEASFQLAPILSLLLIPLIVSKRRRKR